MQEEAVITSQMVPRERVRLSKQVITEERTVDADLQVERVDLEQTSSALTGETDGAAPAA